VCLTTSWDATIPSFTYKPRIHHEILPHTVEVSSPSISMTSTRAPLQNPLQSVNALFVVRIGAQATKCLCPGRHSRKESLDKFEYPPLNWDPGRSMLVTVASGSAHRQKHEERSAHTTQVGSEADGEEEGVRAGIVIGCGNHGDLLKAAMW